MRKDINLAEGRVGKLLIKLAVPVILAQVINLLYNVVDRIYIGKLPDGDMAMAGLGVAMPILMLISAFSLLIGIGGAPLAAIFMGKQENEKAERILGNSITLLFLISILLTVCFSVFKEPLLHLFGAGPSILNYAKDYLSVYLYGTVFVQLSLGLNPFINTQGYTKTGMISVLIGAVVNIILDPVFIFGLKMGVKGAALASVIAQFISAIWIIKFLFGNHTKLKIRSSNLLPDKKLSAEIIALGIAPFIMHGSESLILISLNRQLFQYGGAIAVSSMTIISSLVQIIILPLLGLTQGAQPILSYNYGAGKIKRVKAAFRLLFLACIIFTTAMETVYLCFSEQLVMIFNTNEALVNVTSHAMGIYFVGIFAFGAQLACQQTFLALGKAKQSMVLVVLRKIILLIPLIYILPLLFKNHYEAVLLAEPVTDIVSTSVTVICFFIFYKKQILGYKAPNSSGQAGIFEA